MTTATEPKKLPVGTTPETAKLHKRIQVVCIVLWVGLVLEGTIGMPLLMVWYGWPTLSMKEICDELDKHTFNDPTRECVEGAPLNSPPFGGHGEKPGGNDKGVVQPVPHNNRIGFRDLVRIHEQRVAEAKAKAEAKAGQGK